ncbi:DCC1-like thiol-disulfide oxidoreductase family protein [Candidatus Poseidonia sp.]|nr:DCC1-like thiol-disulfide oxidoreductase family protein [Poseidonia sp.]
MGSDTVLIDGHCDMCNRLAKFLRRHQSGKSGLNIVAIESEEGRAIIQTFSERHQSMDTVYYRRDGHVYVRSGAAIRLLLTMKWYLSMWYPFAWLVPSPLRDGVYWCVSKVRHILG